MDLSPQQSENHAVARLGCSLMTGVHLNLSAKYGLIPPHSVMLATKGAGAQDQRGHRSRPAAHALPSGLEIAGKDVFKFGGTNLGLVELLATPYKFTNIVPLLTNRADSMAERLGLVESLQRFGQANTALLPSWKKATINLVQLERDYFVLVDGYSEAIRLAITSIPKKWEKWIPEGHQRPPPEMIDNVLEPQAIHPEMLNLTESEHPLEMIKSCLRSQAKATLEYGKAMFSIETVKQVEADFHDAKSTGSQEISSHASEASV